MSGPLLPQGGLVVWCVRNFILFRASRATGRINSSTIRPNIRRRLRRVDCKTKNVAQVMQQVTNRAFL